MKHRLLLYNNIINLLWTVLCFLPVLMFWLVAGANSWLYLFLLSSLTACFLPDRTLDKLTLSRNPQFYERAGVKLIRKFVQNGDWARTAVRIGDTRKIRNSGHAKTYLKTVSMYERYHWCCFLFFTQTTFYGLPSKSLTWMASIVAANIIYNLCPIFLQQYNKVKIKGIISRRLAKGGSLANR